MKKIVFVCLSHTLTPEQITDLGVETLIVNASSELSFKTRAIPAGATLSDIQSLAAGVVAEARACNATHFVCQGEPTLAMWANLMAGGEFLSKWTEGINFMGWSAMQCIVSTTERVSVETTNADGSVTKTAVFKHVQWRNLF